MTLIVSHDQLLQESDATSSSIYAKFISCMTASSRVMVIMGAGASVAAGIPDFRSSDGLYAKIEAEYPGLLKKGQHLFDASVLYSSSTSGHSASAASMKAAYFSFLSMMKEMSDGCEPTGTHYFIKWLQDHGKLWRVYTQNIDGLEIKVGLVEPGHLKREKELARTETTRAAQPAPTRLSTKNEPALPSTLFLHGTLTTLSCTLCPHVEAFDLELVSLYRTGKTKECPSCAKKTHDRVQLGKRGFPVGLLTPSILLYNDHPGIPRSQPSFSCGYQMASHTEMTSHVMSVDTRALKQAPSLSSSSSLKNRAAPPLEMVLVMGTSCKVIGIKKWIKTMATCLHQLNHQERMEDPTQKKLTQFVKPLPKKSAANSNATTATSQDRVEEKKQKLLDPFFRRWVVYINKEPLVQKEWEHVFDLQLIGDCDTLTAKIKSDMLVMSSETKENRTPHRAATAPAAAHGGDSVTRPVELTGHENAEESLTPTRVTSYFHVKKSVTKKPVARPTMSSPSALRSA